MDYCINFNQAMKPVCCFDSWSENEHPRDEQGRFTSLGDSKKVRIDFSNDNILPALNPKSLEKLGKTSKPVMVSKRMLERNRREHFELSIDEYDEMLNRALYAPDYVFPANPEKTNYYHFIADIGDKHHSAVIVELSDGKEYHEVVHIHKLRDKSLKTLLKRKKD